MNQNFLRLLSMFGDAEAQDNPDFGKKPGEVDYRKNVDPSKLVQQPYRSAGPLDMLAGNRANEYNAQHAQAIRSSDLMRDRQLDVLKEKAIQDALDRAAAARDALAKIDYENSVKMGAYGQMADLAASRLMPEYMPAATNAQPLVLQQQYREQDAQPLARSMAMQEAYELGPEEILKGGIVNARSAAAQNRQKTYAAESDPTFLARANSLWEQGQVLDNTGKGIANRAATEKAWQAPGLHLGNSFIMPTADGKGFTTFTDTPAQKAGDPTYNPATKKIEPGTPYQPPRVMYGSVMGLQAMPDGSFHDPFTGQVLSMAPGAGVRKPAEVPAEKTPEITPSQAAPGTFNAFKESAGEAAGKWGSGMKSFIDFFRTQGKRDNESWAEYEKRTRKY